MFDTINNQIQADIYEFLFRNPQSRSSEIHAFVTEKEGNEVSLVTVKRLLSKLEEEGALAVTGNGPATRYSLQTAGKLYAHVDAKTYCAQEPDTRFGHIQYQPDLFDALAHDPFSKEELGRLEAATQKYHKRSKDLSDTLHRKEMERFTIELSWKSSKIEGNTYSLLDTERLLLHGEKATGHTQEEAQMILNHKTAFSFIHENRDSFKNLSRAHVEHIHTLLVKDLNIARNIRSSAVGVIGSRYRPLDNRYQLEEALDGVLATVSRMPNGYAKACVALLGLSYLQPFEDGNKRTARLVGNAVLLAFGLAPLSYRSVSEEEYREATLVFYELNSLQPFKDIFLTQYEFAAQNYLIS